MKLMEYKEKIEKNKNLLFFDNRLKFIDKTNDLGEIYRSIDLLIDIFEALKC
jgi:hypothetical protein